MSLLSGKTGLIVGIANDRSYAWYIAQAILQHGGRCAFTHLPGATVRGRAFADRTPPRTPRR